LGYVVGFAYAVDDLADVGGESYPVLAFGWFFASCCASLFCCYFEKASEFLNELATNVLCVAVEFFGEVGYSFLQKGF